VSDDTFKDKLPGWVASGASAVTCTVGLSFLGTSGTLYGLALGSVASGVVQWQYERHLRKAKAVAAKLRADLHARKHPTAIHETIMMNAIAKEADKKIPRGIPWLTIATGAVISLAALCAVIAFIELGTGKPVSDVVQGKAGHGSSFSGGEPPPTTPVPTFAPSTSFSPTASATLAPSPSPSVSLPTPVPSVTVTPPSTTTSASPTATAGATPAPSPPAGATG
jgi:hypothetical protein